ncbi:hypothetical protein [Mycoplasma nasistruthionis]|uniref:Uncharacterized protein n=1 Tax=Mycoplasma nasistruthionis TaxID=353852 RepID=A0A5B7XVY2_9MOLU|nr:hypothetical protein [Mycoplasma nasistruthionis]QCZ36939.1 hypothetical protein FG904_02915 [Mycoplasma nasistruthionis]
MNNSIITFVDSLMIILFTIILFILYRVLTSIRQRVYHFAKAKFVFSWLQNQLITKSAIGLVAFLIDIVFFILVGTNTIKSFSFSSSMIENFNFLSNVKALIFYLTCFEVLVIVIYITLFYYHNNKNKTEPKIIITSEYFQAFDTRLYEQIRYDECEFVKTQFKNTRIVPDRISSLKDYVSGILWRKNISEKWFYKSLLNYCVFIVNSSPYQYEKGVFQNEYELSEKIELASLFNDNTEYMTYIIKANWNYLNSIAKLDFEKFNKYLQKAFN